MQISPYLKDAAIDGEDKNYLLARRCGCRVARAGGGEQRVSAGSVQSGASTIAMQVVRNVQMQDALQLRRQPSKRRRTPRRRRTPCHASSRRCGSPSASRRSSRSSRF